MKRRVRPHGADLCPTIDLFWDNRRIMADTDYELDQPIFLLASERSGTNLIRAIFGAHPDVAAPTPPHLLMNFLPLKAGYGDLSRERNFSRLAEDVCTALDHQLGEWKATITPRQIVEEAGERSFIGAFDYVYAREAAACEAERVFFKENETFYHAYYLLRQFPDARFIYLVRDGRDMVVSFRDSPNHFGTIEDAAEVWQREQQACIDLYTDPSMNDRIFPVHYEDLTTFPGEVISQMCEFVDIPFDDQMLDFHRKRYNIQAANQVTNWRDISKPIDSTNYGKYRDELSGRDLAKVESEMYRELFLTGYPLEESVDKYARQGSLRDVVSKGWQFVRKVAHRKKLMDLEEFQMRRRRVHVFNDMRAELETEHMQPVLRCRALDLAN